jgi:hypothetical protein
MHDNEAVTLYFFAGVERMRANVAVSRVAYAEASERLTNGRAGIVVARVILAQAVEVETRKSRRVELSVD